MNTEFCKNLVEKIAHRAGAFDVFEIAKKNGVKIECGDWYPVTIGEFERKTKTIRVNLRALTDNENGEILKKKIIAHELGHFFAMEFDFNKKDEESFAHQFAEHLIRATKVE